MNNIVGLRMLLTHDNNALFRHYSGNIPVATCEYVCSS